MKRSVLLAVPALLLVAACGGISDMLSDSPTMPIQESSASYVGVWAGYESSARYDLRADGTFTATGLPVDQLDETLYERDGRLGPFRGRGHWKLGPMLKSSPKTPPEESRRAVLTFDELRDADDSSVKQRGAIELNAAMLIDAPPGAGTMFLVTDDDWFQRLR
ncbi:hypothetical protein AB0M36_16930 [Actinoplanes sp. NPDC051346]|uniref:hypothetical protein n=1 Tax=Actinoplanes sp. NPDC051346 TaxID=3155048 RepID=UPI00343C3849